MIRIVRFANSITVNKIKTISMLFILFEINRMSIKIIEPIKQYLKVFNSPDEFNIWYTKNKDEVDTLTTHKLNKMYKIEGYRITKIKNVLMLKKVNETATSSIKDSNGINTSSQHSLPSGEGRASRGESLNSPLIPDEIAELHEEIKNIKTTINQIIQYLDMK